MPDIYDFGFTKNLDRPFETISNSMIYDSVGGLLQANALQLSTGGESIASRGLLQSIAGLPLFRFSTIFETSGRFSNLAGGTGTRTFDTVGVLVGSGATASSYDELQILIADSAAGLEFPGSPSFSVTVEAKVLNAGSGAGSAFFGIGGLGMTSGAGHAFSTTSHMGFKVVKSGSVVGLYATQQHNGVQSVSDMLTTVAAGNRLELILKLNGVSSIDYYYRKQSQNLIGPISLTGGVPNSLSGAPGMTFSVSNADSAFNYSFYMIGATLEKR